MWVGSTTICEHVCQACSDPCGVLQMLLMLHACNLKTARHLSRETVEGNVHKW